METSMILNKDEITENKESLIDISLDKQSNKSLLSKNSKGKFVKKKGKWDKDYK